MKNKYIVGLTGGIGSGKTSVSDLFAKKSIDIVDADIIAREVVMPGSVGLQAILNAFGSQIINTNGELNRALLREIVFKETTNKDKLNAILHPLIRQEMLKQLSNTVSSYCILSAPLLFENKLQTLVQVSLVVDLTEETQLKRTSLRDNSRPETIKGIIAAQISRKERLALADYVIDNSGDIENLQSQVDELHQIFMQQATVFYNE